MQKQNLSHNISELYENTDISAQSKDKKSPQKLISAFEDFLL